jgi:hypothetical protein
MESMEEQPAVSSSAKTLNVELSSKELSHILVCQYKLKTLVGFMSPSVSILRRRGLTIISAKVATKKSQ